MRSYILLDKAGLNPEYEQHTFCLWEGKKFSVPCYDLHYDRKLRATVWGQDTYKPISWKYTPDFVCQTHDKSGKPVMAIIEVKGDPNDVWSYKKKLFLSWLEENAPRSLFFETRNQKQLKLAIQVIKGIKYRNVV